jgi:ubiquinone/menaquinone biosynthesis C-methylase UbiE
VEDRTAILTEDVQSLSFPDRSFDVILSLFCIHNIPTEAGQAAACREIARTLKPGGHVVIGEWLPTHRCAGYFREAGLTVYSSRSHFLKAFGPNSRTKLTEIPYSIGQRAMIGAWTL